jgi:hypothetical protein
MALICLSALCVVGIVILAATGHTIPDVLSGLALVGASGGAGAAIPRTTITSPAP